MSSARLGADAQLADVLLGEEALGDGDEEPGRRGEGRHRHPSTAGRCASAKSSVRAYAASVASNARSNTRTSAPGRRMCAVSVMKRLASIGTSVSETKADARMASETTTANSWNNRPITRA